MNLALSPTLRLSVQIHARAFVLPEQLVRAMTMVESSGDQYAWNPEPKYRYFWDCSRNKPYRALTQAEIDSELPPAGFSTMAGDRDAEWWGQQASWGPLQVMGAVARELGFSKHFPAICDTSLGIELGCKHLNGLTKRFFGKHGWHGVAAAYNAGSPRYAEGGFFENQVYVDKVAKFGGFYGL